tara:strand:- start:358 stop:636 length:279 start_codon:yes stop_codon:yes gene_type:complete
MGAYLKDGLERISKHHSFVTDVRGVGLLLAIEFKDDISADVLAECNQRGLLLNAPSPTTIRIMPPLTINIEEINTGLDRLESGIVEAAREAA